MVWTPGYWHWAGRWVWVPGRYAARPYAHAVWVPGQWRPRHGGWVWVGGPLAPLGDAGFTDRDGPAISVDAACGR